MTAEVKGTKKRCKRLLELPLVVSEWQQQAYCPDCDHYCDGQCEREAGEAECPFEGGVLPLREVTVATPDEELSAVREVEPCSAADRPSLGALEQAIKLKIVDRIGRRVQALAIELTDRELVVRGTAPCYYVKQLALHAALGVLRSACDSVVGLKFDVGVVAPGADPIAREE